MQNTSRSSQNVPAEWTGAPRLIQKWLARRCAVESTMNLAGGATFLVFGLILLAFTSFVTAGLVVITGFWINLVLERFGLAFSVFNPVWFSILFLTFLFLSILHAYRTRWGAENTARVELGNGISTLSTLGWEFLSAGPIMLILSIQDFWRYARLARLDVPQVSTLLLWLYDKGGRAGFAEICLAFPDLNAVRVLPQLRDLPGINWWPDDGEISFSDDLLRTFAKMLGRQPKNAPASAGGFHRSSSRFRAPMPEVTREIAAWYAALNLPLFAPIQQVKLRYRKLAKIYHPDAQAQSGADGTHIDDEAMKRINEAYHNILQRSKAQAGGHV